ncbi:MAG: hypothetical protein JST84_11080 [Acidobacteria bacterium]|nr:hypothetical protein [Acidobacteriota bacterium]
MTSIPNQNLAAIGIARANPSLVHGFIEDRITPIAERMAAMRQVENQKATLPLLATANDLRELIRYLKKYTDGVTIVEALGEVKKRILDPRKISAYEAWGIINRDGDWLSLSPLGWELSRKLGLEAELFRAILDRVEQYRAVLEYSHAQQLKLITQEDIAKFWRKQYNDSLDLHHAKTVEGNVVCFLHLCQAAELGSLTVGKRGQPARLRVDSEELEIFIRSQWDTPTPDTATDAESRPVRLLQPVFPTNPAPTMQVFLSLRPTNKNATQLQTLLELLGVESELLERGTIPSLPMSESAFEVMRRCEAGLFVVTQEDCLRDETGNSILQPEVQAEIRAAYLFYNRRVLLLWDERIPVPTDWQNFHRCDFDGGDLTWETGLQLTKALLSLK